MINDYNLAEVDALGQPLHPLLSEDEARRADLIALIDFNLSLTIAERVQKHNELARFAERVQRVVAKRYGRKVEIQVVGLA
jgi:hypothetical protein